MPATTAARNYKLADCRCTARSALPSVTADYGGERRTEAGQSFVRELFFGIPAREPVEFTLRTRLTQPAFIAPWEDEQSTLRGWIAVAAVSGTVVFGLPVAFAWLLTRRERDGAA